MQALRPLQHGQPEPRHPPFGVRSDDDVAKVSILGMVPLMLQHWAEQADVWTLLLICLCVLVQALQLVGAAMRARTVVLI